MKCSRCGSYAINHNSHGRDGSDPDLCDVCYWRKRADGNEELRWRLSDWQDSFTTAWKTPCPDEVHCSCVPALRVKLDKIENLVTTDHESKESFIAMVRAILEGK